MDIRSYNRDAWDKQVEGGNPWTIPVSPEVIAAARRGEISVLLTEQKPVPNEWIPSLKGLDVLCLASGGGQQAPIFAAAGANVTVLDNSPKQLERDRFVAHREGLQLITIEGDMRDLSFFSDETFDFIFHPVSNLFCPDVLPVWMEAYRVLRFGGTMVAGMVNPIFYIFDFTAMEEKGEMVVKYTVPYSDIESLSPEKLEEYKQTGSPLEFSHTLTDLVGGQCDAGFHIIGFYEDKHEESMVSKYHPTYIATRALKEG
jgi:SAM-dependent methyltransferase